MFRVVWKGSWTESLCVTVDGAGAATVRRVTLCVGEEVLTTGGPARSESVLTRETEGAAPQSDIAHKQTSCYIPVFGFLAFLLGDTEGDPIYRRLSTRVPYE